MLHLFLLSNASLIPPLSKHCHHFSTITRKPGENLIDFLKEFDFGICTFDHTYTFGLHITYLHLLAEFLKVDGTFAFFNSQG